MTITHGPLRRLLVVTTLLGAVAAGPSARAQDDDIVDEGKAIALMLAQPTMIKRPVLDKDGVLTVGFKPDVYATVFKKR